MKSKTTSLKFIFLILLIEGFITISLEILSIRQLLPFVGTSVIVTSLIIGIFLLFLSIGYYLGGNCTKNHLEKLQLNFTIAAFICGIGLSYTFCQVFFYASNKLFEHHLLLSLLIYLLIILAPVILLLGQTIPITTNFFNTTDPVNKISSKTLFISTLGSFFGAILTSLILLNYFGVAQSLFFNVVLLLFFSLSISFIIKKNRVLQLILITIGGSYLYQFNVSNEKQYFKMTNNYGNYQVYQASKNLSDTSYLVVNNVLMSIIDKNNKGSKYIEYVKDVAFKQLKLKQKNILVIGAGGFTFSHENMFDNKFTYIDIDKKVKNIAEKYFLKSKIKGNFIAVDARVYLNAKNTIYDVIFSDPYNKANIPSSLITKEYFLSLKKHLKENGYAFFNVIADPFFNDPYSKHIDNTLNQVFKNCMKHPINYQLPTNIIYICKKTNNEDDHQIYTDNNNQASMEQFMTIDNHK